ncbi:MAG TPA: YihY/virulence factor BrkB family protein [Caulobacteraceae bacterium]
MPSKSRRRHIGSVVFDAIAMAALAGALGSLGDPPTAASKDPPRGWREILARAWRDFGDDHIALISAGVAFHVLLAIFPALLAFVALYGLVADVSQVPDQLRALAILFPADVVTMIGGEMIRLAHSKTGGLSMALVLGLGVSFLSANGAMSALFVGLNVAFEQREKRGFVRLTLTTFAFTLGLLVLAVVTIIGLGAGPAIGAYLGPGARTISDIARWPILLLVFAAELSLLYRFGPSRPVARWRWITPGSAAATVLWVLMSAGLSVYLAQFAHYARTYGSFGALVGLMLWAWLSAIIILTGAELNSELAGETAAAISA